MGFHRVAEHWHLLHRGAPRRGTPPQTSDRGRRPPVARRPQRRPRTVPPRSLHEIRTQVQAAVLEVEGLAQPAARCWRPHRQWSDGGCTTLPLAMAPASTFAVGAPSERVDGHCPASLWWEGSCGAGARRGSLGSMTRIFEAVWKSYLKHSLVDSDPGAAIELRMRVLFQEAGRLATWLRSRPLRPWDPRPCGVVHC